MQPSRFSALLSRATASPGTPSLWTREGEGSIKCVCHRNVDHGYGKAGDKGFLILHPSSSQFRGSQIRDVPGHNPSWWPGEDLGTGLGPALEDPAPSHRCLPAAVSNHYLPSHGIPLLEAQHHSKKSCPKGCTEVVKLIHSRTAGPTPCPPACPYPGPQSLPRLTGRTPHGPWWEN